MTAVTGDGHVLLTAHEGDANHREENRDAENKSTIHPKILQHKTGTYHSGPNSLPSSSRIPLCDGKTFGSVSEPALVQSMPANPDVSLFRLHIMHKSAQARMDKLALRVVLSRIKRID
jgi:hypothetical protein